MHFSPLPCAGRARRSRGAVLLVFLSSTAPIAAAPLSPAPPWAVDSPAAAGDGAFFGYGLDYLFEHQKSLRITSQQTVVPLRTEDGGVQAMVVDGDPDLLNRKFDLTWELNGPGVRVPLALSCFRLTDLIRVFPTLTLETASVDVNLDSISKTEPNPKTSLQGRGFLFGTKIGMTASLCGSCPWFSGTTYHYRRMPSFSVNHSPGFVEPGFEVLGDEVRLSQEVHEFSTLVGHIAPNKRVAYYTGIRARWTDVEIEDKLRLANEQISEEMNLSTRTKLKSETIEAIAGMDTQLGDRVFARTETAVSGQDYGVQMTIVYLGKRKKQGHERAEEIVRIVMPRLERILADFARARSALPVTIEAGIQVYPRGPVIELLENTERALLKALAEPELIAMRDYVEFLFREVHVSLALLNNFNSLRSSWPVSAVLAALGPEASLGLLKPQQGNQGMGAKQTIILEKLEAVGDFLSLLRSLFLTNQIVVDLCIKSTPEADFKMYPASHKKSQKQSPIKTNKPLTNMYRGLYRYSVQLSGFKGNDPESYLDLVAHYGPIIMCYLVPSTESGETFCAPEPGNFKKECPHE